MFLMLLQHVFILWPLSTPGKLPLKLSISKLRQFPFNGTTKCNAQHCTSITKYNMREKKSQQNCLQVEAKCEERFEMSAKMAHIFRIQWCFWRFNDELHFDSIRSNHENLIHKQWQTCSNWKFFGDLRYIQTHTHTRTCAQKRPNYFQYYMNGV